jgi:methionyl-tRNA formyltransferase
VRTVYLGTSDFAVTVLEHLARGPHAPALVVTRPDRPRGRGRRLSPPPVAEAAARLGIETIQPERASAEETVERIGEARPEALVVCAYGALIKEPLLSAWPILNVHPSLLPRWRGAAPVERAILAGDDETGVSIMQLVEALDAGPVYLQDRVPIGAEDTYGTLAPKLAALSGDLLERVLTERPEPRPQSEQGVTYAEKIEREDRRLDPEAEDATALARRVRALTPHIGTWVATGPGEGERLGVVAAVATPDDGPAPGALVTDDGRLLLGTASGALELREVQPPGKRPMAAADYLRGRG